VSVSWGRIERWLEANFPELSDQLNDPATHADVLEFESDRDCTLPPDLKASLTLHDGQDDSGRPCGLLFGIYLMDMETIEEEWNSWKKVAKEYEEDLNRYKSALSVLNGPYVPPISAASQARNAAATGGPNSPASGTPSSSGLSPVEKKRIQALGKFIESQSSVPEGAVQCVYSHPDWIPVAYDKCGNNIGIDLNPGPAGTWGQVILFGQDYDRKYVVAKSWAHFLCTFADDLE
ncbi:hypothetical protein CANCADRAFT_13756, partial [Tortispora caseinolytica NRRL Y-17796]